MRLGKQATMESAPNGTNRDRTEEAQKEPKSRTEETEKTEQNPDAREKGRTKLNRQERNPSCILEQKGKEEEDPKNT